MIPTNIPVYFIPILDYLDNYAAIMSNIKPQNSDNIDLAFEVMNRKIESQSKAHISLEAKISTLFNFTGALSGGTLVLITTNAELLGKNLLTLSFISLYITLLLLVIASLPGTYYDPPSYKDVYSKESLTKNVWHLKNQLISNIVEGYKKNRDLQILKGRLYTASTISFIISFGFALLSLINKIYG